MAPQLRNRGAALKVGDRLYQFDSRTGIPEDTPDEVIAELRRMGALREESPSDSGPLGLAATDPANQPTTEGDGGGGGDSSPTIAEIDVAAASVEDLARHIETGKGGKPLNVSETVALAGGDQALAEKVAAAERLQTGDDPRSSVIDGLSKIGE